MPCCDLHPQHTQLLPQPEYPSMPCSHPPETGMRERRRATLVLVSKYPTPGASKTRLIPAFGSDGAASFAMAMLTDILRHFAKEDAAREFRKVFVYAPSSAGPKVRTMLETMGLEDKWEMEPVADGMSLQDGRLTPVLEAALANARATEREQAVIFIGMDTPQLPWSEVKKAKHVAEKDGDAYICPASDGGYTLLGLPPAAGSGAFQGVRWSEECTCNIQRSVLEAMGVRTLVGGTYDDVDEADDVARLERRAALDGLSEVSYPQTLRAARTAVWHQSPQSE